MKWIFRAIVLAIVFGPVLVGFAMIEPAPLVSATESVNVEDVGRIKALLEKNDPRDLREGERREVELTARDINLALAYGLSRLPVSRSMHAKAVLAEGHGDLQITVPLEDLSLSGFVNATARLVPDEHGVKVDSISIGQVSVPRAVWRWATDQVRPQLDNLDGYWELRDLLGAASNVRFTPDAIGMTMMWQGDLARRIEERGRAMLLPAADRDRIVEYLNTLAIETGGARGTASLATLIGPVFAHAQRRASDGGDASVESRAALVALALYVAADTDGLRRVLGDEAAAAVNRVPRLDVRLRGRHDLAQHFLVSAALSVASNSALADVIGVFKEEQDSRGGSGFSFADLAADRAGIRFAESAVADPSGWQSRARALTLEEEFMPEVDALPEGMQQPDFVVRFENRDSDAYAQVIAEIDRRLARCPLYQ